MVGLFTAAAAAIPELFKLAQSGKDKSLGEQYLKTPRPQFRTPDEVFRSYNRLQQLAAQPLPGKGYMEEDLEQGVSSGVRGLQEIARPTEAAAGAMGLYGQQLDQRRQLAMDEALLRREGQKDLAGFETDVLAEYKNKMFDINKFQPYQQAQAAARALLSSSEQNMYSGLTGISRIGVQLASELERPEQDDTSLADFFGGGTTAAGDELRFGSNKTGLNFDYGTPTLPQDDSPYGYQPPQPGTVPFQYRKYGKIKSFVP